MPTLLFGDHTRMALSSIRSNKTRSLLTMVGIIIGVSSVILTVALGEGIRRQIVDSNQAANDRLITVQSGAIATRDKSGTITGVNYLAALGSNTLTETDYQTLAELAELEAAVPLSTISGLPSNFDQESYPEATLVATTSNLPAALNQELAYGGFFSDENSGRNSVVIGPRVAEELFGENVPLGKLLTIRGQDFVVGGIFNEFKTNPLSAVTDLNKAVFLSYETAKDLVDGTPSIYQILLLPKEGVSTKDAAAAAHRQLLVNHGQQEDFTVLLASETDQVARLGVSLASSFIAGIAAISLLVGGIGIMNIMFVSVTERTREIGVRKSLGATNRQIYSQFLTEAAVLSMAGGIIGIGAAMAGTIVVRLLSDLEPAVTWQIVLLAVGVSAAVGIVFGTAPAVKAASKDPIESLRYE